jgi:hypothetical protein
MSLLEVQLLHTRTFGSVELRSQHQVLLNCEGVLKIIKLLLTSWLQSLVRRSCKSVSGFNTFGIPPRILVGPCCKTTFIHRRRQWGNFQDDSGKPYGWKIFTSIYRINQKEEKSFVRITSRIIMPGLPVHQVFPPSVPRM